MQSLKAALNGSWPQRSPSSHRACDTLQVFRPKVLKVEQVADELSGVFGNHDAVRLRHALQACSEIRRLADDSLLLRSARADQIADNHQPGRDAYARLERRVGLKATHRSH